MVALVTLAVVEGEGCDGGWWCGMAADLRMRRIRRKLKLIVWPASVDRSTSATEMLTIEPSRAFHPSALQVSGRANRRVDGRANGRVNRRVNGRASGVGSLRQPGDGGMPWRGVVAWA